MAPESFKARIDRLHAELDRRSYYELLGVAPEVGPDEIRAAFHRLALAMHPDCFHSHPDADLRGKLYAIYKRLTEAYKVLGDSQDRRQYDEAVSHGQLRLVRVDKRRSGPPRTAAGIDHPQARKFFELAQAAERRKDYKGARLNYKFAADLIGDHPAIRESLERLDREQK